MKAFSDVLLIIAWMYVIANHLHYNGWLIVLSVIFWFFNLYDTPKNNGGRIE